jgi:hypothetical protein
MAGVGQWPCFVHHQGDVMKRKGFPLAVIALLATAPLCAQMAGVPVVTNATQAMYTSIGAYGQASYFHEVVKQRRCDLLDANAVDSIDQRFESVRVQLRSRYGEPFSKIDKPPALLQQSSLPCDRLTLDSYNRHVGMVEQLLQESAGLH